MKIYNFFNIETFSYQFSTTVDTDKIAFLMFRFHSKELDCQLLFISGQSTWFLKCLLSKPSDNVKKILERDEMQQANFCNSNKEFYSQCKSHVTLMLR